MADCMPRDRRVIGRLLHIFHDPQIEEAAKIAALLDATMVNTYLPTAVMTALIACITATGAYMSLHTSSPSTTGANELLGSSQSGYSSGGYTGYRKSLTWAAYSSPGQISSNSQTFALLATQAGGIPYFGIWTADDGGTYIAGGPTSGLSGSIPNGANVVFATGATVLTMSD